MKVLFYHKTVLRLIQIRIRTEKVPDLKCLQCWHGREPEKL